VIGPFDGSDPEGAIPLGDEQVSGLRPSWVATRSDLNVVEASNIADATQWAYLRSWTPAQILTERALLGLHRRMLSQVWSWAGGRRKQDTNIGVDGHLVPVRLRQLLDDAATWIEFNSYPADEIAARFHHRLVAIHLFPNGNGRHARLAADVLVISLGRPAFTWGAETLVSNSATRSRYLSALRRADTQHDYGELLLFVRS